MTININIQWNKGVIDQIRLNSSCWIYWSFKRLSPASDYWWVKNWGGILFREQLQIVGKVGCKNYRHSDLEKLEKLVIEKKLVSVRNSSNWWLLNAWWGMTKTLMTYIICGYYPDRKTKEKDNKKRKEVILKSKYVTCQL